MAPNVLATPLVGRARELDELAASLARGERLVTLTGAGGIGKSRIASELARRVAAVDRSRGDAALGELEIVLVTLDDAADLDALADATAAALGAGPGGSSRGPAWPLRVLASRGPTLLVLDPLDRIAGAASRVVEWLAGAPELAILCVSRSRLGVAGELVHEVGPLEREGVELFVATTGARGLELGASERRAIEEIVRVLDGVPLAIELAASRTSVMSPTALLHRLRSRFEILRRPAGAGGGAGSSRHSALEASIAWSWETLDPWERDALTQCTVFRGGFDIEAAEAVVALAGPGAPPVLDVVAALRAKSMLRARTVSGDLRLSLDESVRAFAERSLTTAAAGAMQELEARHAEHFVTRAEAWSARTEAAEGDDARARLLVERENLLAVVERILGRRSVSARVAERALRALVALAPVLEMRGPLEVYAAHLERALEVTAGSGADPRLQARGLLVRGALRRQRGDLAGAERDLGEALVLASHTGDAAVEGRALLAIARLATKRGAHEPAAQGVERAIERVSSAGDAAGLARVLLARAAIASARGDRERARDELESAAARARAARSAVVEAAVRRRLALLDLEEGRGDDARAHLRAASMLADALQDLRGRAVAVVLSALADQLEGELERASEAYRSARADLATGGFLTLEAIASGLLGVLHAERGDRAEARLLVQGAREALGGVDAALDVFFGCVVARIEALAGREARARALLEGARGSREAVRDTALRTLFDALERGEDPAPGTLAADLVLRVRLLDAPSVPPPANEGSGDVLRIGEGGAWFRAGEGARVELARRKPLRRILDRLADEHARQPGAALAWDALMEAGWPGEKMRAEAGAHRVRVAISTLRKMGLREALRTDEQGYSIGAEVKVVRG